MAVIYRESPSPSLFQLFTACRTSGSDVKRKSRADTLAVSKLGGVEIAPRVTLRVRFRLDGLSKGKSPSLQTANATTVERGIGQ